MSQPPAKRRQASGDEGAEQTALIVAAVKALRQAKTPPWSAQRLAEEMTKVGVPWNRDIVVNLERGRRKSLRVHEALALAYVLGPESPLDVLVPYVSALYPVTPDTAAGTVDVRRWFSGETGPLREWVEAEPDARNRAENERGRKHWHDAVADAQMRGFIRITPLGINGVGDDDGPR